MTFDRKRFSVRSTPVACAVASVLAVAAAMPAVAQEGLEEIVVTAQRRETSLQTTPIAISAYAGDKLEEDKIFSVADLAGVGVSRESWPAASLVSRSSRIPRSRSRRPRCSVA